MGFANNYSSKARTWATLAVIMNNSVNDTNSKPPAISSEPTRYGFLLMPEFSMIAFSSAIEVLRMANQLRQQKLYEWPMYTLDGTPVAASNGINVTPDGDINDVTDLTACLLYTSDAADE